MAKYRRGGGGGGGNGGGGGRYQGQGQGQGRQNGAPRGRYRPGRGGGNNNNRRRANGPVDQRRDPFPVDDADPSALVPGSGVLEMHPNGYGFLRNPATNFVRERTDPFVPGTMIEKYGLREGVLLHGMVQGQRRGQGPRLRELLDVDGLAPEDYPIIKDFDSLTPINPE